MWLYLTMSDGNSPVAGFLPVVDDYDLCGAHPSTHHPVAPENGRHGHPK